MSDQEDEETNEEALWALVDKGLLNFSYDAERDDWVFWLAEGVDVKP